VDKEEKVEVEDEEEDDIEKIQGNANVVNNNRRKFTVVDDNFLLLGLRQFGYKEVEMIKNAWLPNKSTNEIKHRYKNLTCAKAQDNIIKRWKNTHSIPLSDYEEK